MSTYPGKSFVPRLPLERCRPLEERVSVRTGPAPEALAKASRSAVAGEAVMREIEQARDAALARAKRQKRERAIAEARAAGRLPAGKAGTGPTTPNPWRGEP